MNSGIVTVVPCLHWSLSPLSSGINLTAEKPIHRTKTNVSDYGIYEFPRRKKFLQQKPNDFSHLHYRPISPK